VRKAVHRHGIVLEVTDHQIEQIIEVGPTEWLDQQMGGIKKEE
tara:strand:+ start:548 stop:676 length:129 start_codon:yes stop_codon:yes gene_type:complete